MGRLRNSVAVLAAGYLGAIGVVGIAPRIAGASVVLDNDRYLIPATTVAGADTGFVNSQTGPTANYGGSNMHIELPPGMVIAHADSRPGVPPSPISNRPTDGDDLGSLTLTSFQAGGDCLSATTNTYRYVWNEWNWHGPDDPMKVAEIRVEYTWGLDLSAYGVWINVRLTGSANGLPTYEVTIPSSATRGFFCDGTYYRQTSTMRAPAGKTLARNSYVPGPQTICTNGLSNAGVPVGYCTDYTLEAADGTSATLSSPPQCTITGTDGPDILRGTSGDDVICALGGDDRVVAGAGNDVVIGGGGNDRINGGTGADYLVGDSGDDIVSGAADNDAIYGGSGTDSLSGAGGDDFLNGGSGDDREAGGAGADTLEGGLGSDRLAPGIGDDRAVGGPGADTIAGGAGNDAVSGGDGPDTLNGNAGSDLLYGGPDADSCQPEPAADLGMLTDC